MAVRLDRGAFALESAAIGSGLDRAEEVVGVADGALWTWNLIKDRFSEATQTLDFYYGSEYLWSLPRHLHPGCFQFGGIRLRPISLSSCARPQARNRRYAQKQHPSVPLKRIFARIGDAPVARVCLEQELLPPSGFE
jgi:hypothetical protein